MNISKKYDVIVAGGGTAGVSCAWNCARLGLKTLLIELNSYLGGSITSSLVIPAMKTSDNSINNIFFNELYNELYKVNGSITYSDGNKGWYNPNLTKIILDKMLYDNNIDILFESYIKNIIHKENKILSVSIDTLYNDNIGIVNNNLLSHIETKYLVDATGDGKICQKLNCEILDDNENSFQPNSLRFIMSGININKFSKWLTNLDNNKDVTTCCNVKDNIYLSTAYTWDTNVKWALKPLFDEAIRNGELSSEDANYFQIFSVAGTKDSIAFNAPRLLNTNANRSELYIQGRSSIHKLACFCKKYLPGFDNAYISSIADKLGVRLSNRIKGKYIYTYNDLISGAKFKNPVLVSNYPVDIHSNEKNKSTLEHVNIEYQLPIESLIVDGFSNLFVIGRCISVDFKAQAALRIIPSCFSMGEGLAAHLSTLEN